MSACCWGCPEARNAIGPTQREDEDALTQAIVALASQYGRYGYRRITALLQRAGWQVGKDRVELIWRREGLKVPKQQKPRGRLWLNDGSCVRLRPTHPNHIWNYDFVSARTHDGRSVRILGPDYQALPRGLHWPVSWYGRECQSTYVPTMVLSSSRRICANGLRTQEQRRYISNPTLPGRTDTANHLTPNSEMSSSTERSSSPSKNCVCWRNVGASTTTPSDHTPRSDINHQHRRRGSQQARGMEKWKPLRASHFSTPQTADI